MCASAAHLTLMGSLIIVVVVSRPSVQIDVQLVEVQVEPLLERDLIKLLQDGCMKALADAVRPRVGRALVLLCSTSLTAK